LKVEEGRYVAERIPGAKYVEFPGRDHLPFVGDQDAILVEVEEFLTGARTSDRAAHLLDRVLTTVLFILFDDLASTTSVHSRQELNELQQTYARHELAHFRGREIEMTDDHLFATFDGPARAIRCALAIADAAARLSRRVKGGLHTGECEILGPMVSGVTVRLGEAIARSATFREVLISPTVKDLVAGSGIEFEPRRAPDVADLPGGWQLFSVRRSAER